MANAHSSCQVFLHNLFIVSIQAKTAVLGLTRLIPDLRNKNNSKKLAMIPLWKEIE